MGEKKLVKDTTIVIHSTNVVVRQQMKNSLEEYHTGVYLIDFTVLRKMKREDFS